MIGLFFEEMQVGQVIEQGSYYFAPERVKAFARAFAPVGFHLNEDQAEQGLLGAPSAPGFYTTSAWMARFVATNTEAREHLARLGKRLPEIGPSPGISDVRWPRPTHPGETLTFRTTITAKRELKTRPRWGIVSMHAEGFNAKGELAMSFDGKVLVERLP